MAKEVLKKQLDDIQGSINDTLAVVRKLLAQADSVSVLIEQLSTTEVEPSILEKLREIQDNLNKNIDELIDSLSRLFEEYQEFLRKSL